MMRKMVYNQSERNTRVSMCNDALTHPFQDPFRGAIHQILSMEQDTIGPTNLYVGWWITILSLLFRNLLRGPDCCFLPSSS
jgi:hypothetical protein